MRTALSNKDLNAINQPEVARALAERAKEPPKTDAQSYAEQIVKYIPAEVVAFYIPALGVATGLKPTTTGTETTSSAYGYVVWAIFLLALVGTFMYMLKNAKTELEEKKIDNVGERSLLKAAISTLAFFIWALYLGGPFVGIEGYATYGALAILGFTFITPALYDAVPIPLRKQK